MVPLLVEFNPLSADFFADPCLYASRRRALGTDCASGRAAFPRPAAG